MTIEKTMDGNILTIVPHGRLDSTTSDEFSDFLVENITDDMEQIVLDFKDVEFISSKGLRVIVSAHKNIEGRKLTIINANTSVMEVLRLTGLINVLDVE